ncbi:translation initiation factor IF-3 [Candidatus Gracilibacteria bacterium]|nr:MAG: translation initiation factor IF-3 [Candidatus Gracilibacteria bacterium]
MILKEKKKLLNDEIRATKVQLISEDGENLGNMSLDEARSKANSLGLDMMEIGRKDDLSIVKLLDYGKFLYKQKKQDQKNKQKGKAPDLKTIRITFKIGEHDLEIRKNQAEKFAKGGHPLKITLMLRGRENQYENIAKEKMDSFITRIEEFYKLDGAVKKTGNTFTAMLKPNK